MEYQFEWDPQKDESNQRKHGVSFRHAATVFRDPNQLSLFDEEHSEDEDRWITLGLDCVGILRVVVHIFREESEELCRIRIISARKADPDEVTQYLEQSL